MIKKIHKIMKLTSPKGIDNEKGAVLIISMFVLTVLFGLTACFSLAGVGELNESNRYLDSTEAFWVAEAAINRFIHNTAMLDSGDETIQFGVNSVLLSKDDSNSSVRVVTATATANGVERVVSVQFPADIPDLYDNTLSSGGGASIGGFIGGMSFDGQSRISGTYSADNGSVSMTFDDLQENVSSSETTLGYEDVDGNSTADEFTDFVEYNRRLTDPTDPNFTGEYTSDEVLYVQSNDTVEIWPDTDLAGIKVLFVEGSSEGQGDVEIWFNTTWADNQNLTVVSTGSVTYIQPLTILANNSQLNTVSWDDYNEGSILYSAHSGVTYTHGAANFGSIASLSTTSGAIIANEGVDAFLVFVGKQFNYEDPIDAQGLVPPAFQGLVSSVTSGYSDIPSNWAEVWEVASQ